MTRALAHAILDRWREGEDYADWIIYRALIATGDITEGE